MIKLSRLKEHLRVYGNCDDEYIRALESAARKLFEKYTGTVLYEEGTDLTGLEENAVAMDDLIAQGALLFIGHLYEHREAVSHVSMNSVPMATEYLWQPYRQSLCI